MGESNDLSKNMPDKTKNMIRKLDAYLKKVGAWTIKEVYDTRQEELEAWIERDRKKLENIQQLLTDAKSNATEHKDLRAKLNATRTHLTKHQENLKKLANNRKSASWF